MKKLIFTLLLGLTSLGLCNADLAGYTINKYGSNFTITKNGLLEFIESPLNLIIIVVRSIILCIILFYIIRAGWNANKIWIDFKEKKQKLTQTHGKKIRNLIHFSLPKGYTAAEVAAIYNRKSNFDSLSAFLFSRIQDNYVRLEHVSQKSLFFKSSNYEFKINTETPKFKFDESRRSGDYLHFQNPEEKFWNLCFITGDINDLDSFKENQSELLKQIADEVFYSIHSKLIPQYGWLNFVSYSLCDKYKTSSPRLPRKEFAKSQSNFFCLISMLLCGIVALFLMIKLNLDMRYLNVIVPFLLGFTFTSAILNLIISGTVKAILKKHEKSGFKNIGEDEKYITRDGIDVVEQIFGFRKYLLKVDDNKLRALLSEDSTYFEKILPYAIALGVGNHWIKKCMKYLSEMKDMESIDQYNAISLKIGFSRSISKRIHTIDRPHRIGGGSGDESSYDSDRGFSSGSSFGGGFSLGGGGGGGGGRSW